MAIIRLAPPFDAFHGTVSGVAGNSKLTIFSTSKAAAVSRTWVVPANPQTASQMLIRSYQISAATFYKTHLTPEQAVLWRAAAAQINRDNILHLSYVLSGINLFCMINVYRFIDGLFILPDCPEIIAPPIPTAVSSVSLLTDDTLTIVGQVPGAHVGQLVMVRVSRPLPSANRMARRNEVRLMWPWIDCIVAAGESVVTFTLGILVDDYKDLDRVGVELTPLSENYFPGTKYLEPNIGVVAYA